MPRSPSPAKPKTASRRSSACPRAEVDVLLLDVRMPKKSGVDVLRELAAADALPPTLVLTTFDDTAVVLDAIRSGARGFLLKDISYQQLMSAIRAIAAGGTVFQPAITQRLLRAAGTIAPDAMPLEELTARELEVVRLMAGGYSNKEIAHALGTAEGTIKNQVSSILAKFGVRDRTRAGAESAGGGAAVTRLRGRSLTVILRSAAIEGSGGC